MKIRLGFVSNSSSSSFCLFSVRLDMDELNEVTELNKITIGEDDGDYEKVEQLAEKAGLGYVTNFECDEAYIGEGPEDIGLEETRGDFQKRVTKRLKTIHIKDKPMWNQGEIYN